MKQVSEVSTKDLERVRGGDWFETTWGVMGGAAFVAGFLGSGGFLAIAAGAGAVLVLEVYI